MEGVTVPVDSLIERVYCKTKERKDPYLKVARFPQMLAVTYGTTLVSLRVSSGWLEIHHPSQEPVKLARVEKTGDVKLSTSEEITAIEVADVIRVFAWLGTPRADLAYK
jgi:hypothetical protein